MSDSQELMPAVILAGGLATRLRPLTAHIPKALIEIEGHPFLWHQLRLLKRHGIRRFVLLVGYLGDRIQERFGDGSQHGISIEYSFDGPDLLGTAGAIRNALQLLPELFFVLYGDSYLPCDYRAVETAFRRSGLPGLMTVYRNENLYDASNVEYDGTRILSYDKRNRTPDMHHIDYGLGAFQRNVFVELPPGKKCDLTSVYQNLISAGKLRAFEVHDRFYEIGSPEGLREATEFLRNWGSGETTVPLLGKGGVGVVRSTTAEICSEVDRTTPRPSFAKEGNSFSASALSTQTRRAVFLDRDGVLNEAAVQDGKPCPPAAKDFRIIPGTAEALVRLKQEGFLLLVVTNQPDVARGNQTRDTVEEMERRLRAELPLDDVFTCFHDDADACDCRKPRPGLIMRAARQYGIDLSRSYMTGDRWRDIDAGANAGCKTIWIDRGYRERPPASVPDARVASLPEAVNWILEQPLESL